RDGRGAAQCRAAADHARPGRPGARRGAPATIGRVSTASAAPPVWTAWLGTIPYGEALALQKALEGARQRGEIPDVLLLLEHPPVYTKGRRTGADDLPMSEDWYRA